MSTSTEPSARAVSALALAALACALACVLTPTLAACGPTDGRAEGGGARPVRVFAASSLTAPLEAMAERFEASPGGGPVDLHFAGTPTLLLQLDAGARADVLAPADSLHMARAEASGHVRGAPATLARNGLGIVVAAGNPRGVRGLGDLADPELRVALCGPAVPAGRYARAALARAGVEVRSVSDEPNVRALVAKVALGELDAAIAYATDARGSGGAVELVPIAPEHSVAATYPIALVGDGDAGAAFLAFACSPGGAAILVEHGFLAP